MPKEVLKKFSVFYDHFIRLSLRNLKSTGNMYLFFIVSIISIYNLNIFQQKICIKQFEYNFLVQCGWLLRHAPNPMFFPNFIVDLNDLFRETDNIFLSLALNFIHLSYFAVVSCLWKSLWGLMVGDHFILILRSGSLLHRVIP